MNTVNYCTRVDGGLVDLYRNKCDELDLPKGVTMGALIHLFVNDMLDISGYDFRPSNKYFKGGGAVSQNGRVDRYVLKRFKKYCEDNKVTQTDTMTAILYKFGMGGINPRMIKYSMPTRSFPVKKQMTAPDMSIGEEIEYIPHNELGL